MKPTIKTQVLVSLLTIISHFSFSQVKDIEASTMQINREPIINQVDINVQDVIMPKNQVLWENDFSDVSDWSFTNTSSPNYDWEIITQWPTNLSGNGLLPPNFMTANNGYALVNSDGEGGNATQNAELIVSNSIDLSSHSYVTLEFSQYTRRFNTSSDQYYLGFSIDDGETWDEVEINTNLATNETSDNPDLFSLNISDIAGNTEKFKFKFQYIGSYGWFWAVDDVRLVTPEYYDLASENPKHYAGDASAFDQSLSEGLDYYKVPLSQLANLNFSAQVSNKGIADQSQATFNLEVFNEENEKIFIENSDPFAISSGETARVFLDKDYTPSEEGIYTFKTYANPDQEDLNPSNDTVSIENFLVGGNEYARDNGEVTRYFRNAQNNEGMQINVGNLFEFFGEFTIRNINIYIGNGSSGEFIYGSVYKYNEDTQSLEYYTETQVYEVQQEDEQGFVSLPLYDGSGSPNYVDAKAGEVYLITAGHYGGELISFGLAQDVEDISVLFYNSSGELGYFGNMRAVMVRASDQCHKNVDLTKTNATACGASDGTININIDEPSVTSHTITWEGTTNGSATINASTDNYLIENLSHGEYTIIVEDLGGCISKSVVQILEEGAPTINVDVISQISCAGKEDAELSISSTDNLVDYTFTWSNNDNGTTTTVGAGDYSVSGEGAECSTNIVHITVEEGERLPISINQVSLVSCNGMHDAVLEVNSTENISDYTFLWNTGETETSITVGTGIYSVEGQGECLTEIPQLSVSQPAPILINGQIINDIEIKTNIFGGTPVYTLSWSGPNGFTSTDENIVASTNGDYTLTVVDENDCSTTEVFTIDKVGLSENSNSEISIYPNPSNNIINFDLSMVEASYIQIFDLTGKEVVKKYVSNKGIVKISVDSLSDGMYVYHIIDKKQALISSDKIIVSK